MDSRPDADWLLKLLVDLLASGDAGNSLGITLQVSGIFVSGELIGGRQYFDGMTEEFVAAAHIKEVHPTTLSEALTQIGDDVYGGAMEEAGPGYIHLKNARFLTADGQRIPTNRGVYWRGKLTSIDGFNVGILSSGPSEGNKEETRGKPS